MMLMWRRPNDLTLLFSQNTIDGCEKRNEYALIRLGFCVAIDYSYRTDWQQYNFKYYIDLLGGAYIVLRYPD